MVQEASEQSKIHLVRNQSKKFNPATYRSATIMPEPKILPTPATCPLLVPGRAAVEALNALDSGRLRIALGGLPAMFLINTKRYC